MPRFRVNQSISLVTAVGGLLAAVVGSSLLATAEPGTDVPKADPSAIAASIADPWQPASPEEEDQILGFILESPLGIAALNQLAIEGFINPLCEKTFYTHSEYGSFQSLMQVQCPTSRGVNTARGYDEMRVVFNRFEDTIIDFEVERIFVDEAGLPGPVAEATLQAAIEQSGVDRDALTIAGFEQRTWSDGCLGLGGPAEGCLTALVEGWQVTISDGSSRWVFRTNDDGSQVRLDPQST